MTHRSKLFLAGLLFGAGAAVATPPRTAAAQFEIDEPDCTYGSFIKDEKCQGETTRCCKCKIGCPTNQE